MSLNKIRAAIVGYSKEKKRSAKTDFSRFLIEWKNKK